MTQLPEWKKGKRFHFYFLHRRLPVSSTHMPFHSQKKERKKEKRTSNVVTNSSSRSYLFDVNRSGGYDCCYEALSFQHPQMIEYSNRSAATSTKTRIQLHLIPSKQFIICSFCYRNRFAVIKHQLLLLLSSRYDSHLRMMVKILSFFFKRSKIKIGGRVTTATSANLLNKSTVSNVFSGNSSKLRRFNMI